MSEQVKVNDLEIFGRFRASLIKFAQAAADKPSRFLRVMILPRELQGKSSIQYVNEDDKAKPKSQSYKIYGDAPIAFEVKK